LPHHRGGRAPSGVELRGFAGGEAMGGEDLGQRLAVFRTAPRYRHQALHGHVRRDRPVPHLLLHALGQQFDQGQPPRYPLRTAVEAAGQFFHPEAKLPLQFHQQPAFFQRRLAFAPAQATIQQQGFGLTHGPQHGFHGVSPQLLQGGDALVAIDHQITVGLVCNSNHHNRRLLAHRCQRGQQAPLPLGTMHPQMLPAPVELMKLQLHNRAEGKHVPRRDQYVGIISPRPTLAAGPGTRRRSRFDSARAGLRPAPLPLPDPLQRPPARVRTEPLPRTSPLPHKSFVAAWPVAGRSEKNLEGLPSRPPQGPLARLVSVGERAPGSAGFARSAAVCPPPCPGISPALSTATTPAPLAGNLDCNTAAALAAGGSAARILSADTPAAAPMLAAGADPPLDFRHAL